MSLYYFIIALEMDCYVPIELEIKSWIVKIVALIFKNTTNRSEEIE